ncbi:hypothetical protein PROSTU_04451 [Providencia stuartii ATCC 25827]|uniref:Uncharacterized protein n=1 Tax=Providencia stuartii ATCC 25827 TaxID=471874 RepID=A0AA87CP74_PROST|nr:hypothetical protein PROSTU_04451 [Providencia stuartii ATCC 25827]
MSTTKVVCNGVFILLWFYLVVFPVNLFSKKSQIGMQITYLEGRGHKKALAGRAGLKIIV